MRANLPNVSSKYPTYAISADPTYLAQLAPILEGLRDRGARVMTRRFAAIHRNQRRRLCPRHGC
jgi:hypothetical protein